MAKGWESKSVEDQISERQENAAARPEAIRLRNLENATKVREQQSLELQRERILDQRTASPHRRAALEAALADIEARLLILQ
jgi:hypothetical protein